MSTAAMRIIIAIVTIFHGIGHFMGLMPILGIKLSDTHSAKSRLLTGFLSDKLSQATGFLVWSAALLCFVLAGLALLGWPVPPDWWMVLMKSAAIISLVGLVFFWDAFPFFFPNKIGVITVDCALLISMFFLEWPHYILGT
jgi:hypothetical protein